LLKRQATCTPNPHFHFGRRNLARGLLFGARYAYPFISRPSRTHGSQQHLFDFAPSQYRYRPTGYVPWRGVLYHLWGGCSSRSLPSHQGFRDKNSKSKVYTADIFADGYPHNPLNMPRQIPDDLMMAVRTMRPALLGLQVLAPRIIDRLAAMS
jgi:hypothetical protein